MNIIVDGFGEMVVEDAGGAARRFGGDQRRLAQATADERGEPVWLTTREGDDDGERFDPITVTDADIAELRDEAGAAGDLTMAAPMFIDTTPATTEWVVEAYQNRHFDLRGRFETEAEARECARRICGTVGVEDEMTIQTYLTYNGRAPMLALAHRAREEMCCGDTAAQDTAMAIAAALGATRAADDYRQVRELAALLGPYFAELYLTVVDREGPDSEGAAAAWRDLVAATDGEPATHHAEALARRPAPPPLAPPFTATIGVPEDCDCTSVEVWLTAVMAAPSPPLWARLASAAFDGGWPREGQWDERAARAVVSAAVLLSDAADAPASDRVTGTDYVHGCPEDGQSYTTCTGTTVRVRYRTVTIEGEGPSVLRRAIAAARAAGVPYAPEDGLVQAAIVAAREHAALRAESALLSSIATVRPTGRGDVAE